DDAHSLSVAADAADVCRADPLDDAARSNHQNLVLIGDRNDIYDLPVPLGGLDIPQSLSAAPLPAVAGAAADRFADLIANRFFIAGPGSVARRGCRGFGGFFLAIPVVVGSLGEFGRAERSPLSETVFADGEQVHLRMGDHHADHVFPLRQVDP